MDKSAWLKNRLADCVIALAIIGGFYFSCAFITALLVIELSKAGWTIVP